jgi:peptidoglycan biosynthesis protein MviN/MurJ (putative lipid II flippase)
VDPLTFAVVFQLLVTLGAVAVLGVVVDARARRRDAATRALIAGMEARVIAAVTAKVTQAVRVMIADRATPTSIPPTLQ